MKIYACLVLLGMCFHDGQTKILQSVQLGTEKNTYLWPQRPIVLKRRKQFDLTAVVMAAVNNLQAYMKNGNKSLGIPVMEPFVFNQTSYDISSSNDVIRLNGELEGTIVGLTDFSITSCNTELAGLWANLTLEFGEIRATGTYNTNSLIAGVLPLEGQGNYDITLKKVTANFQPQFTGNTTNESLKQFLVSYSIQESKMDVTGLMGEMNDIMTEFIQDARQAILKRSLAWVEDALQRTTIKFTTDTIFKNGMTDNELLQYLQAF